MFRFLLTPFPPHLYAEFHLPVSNEEARTQHVISHLASPGSSVLTILAALGALAGLYLFFCGFWLLHRKAPVANRAPQTQPAIATITATFTTQRSETLARTSSREIIRLSPELDESSLSPNTQQGKIAAALLKAGMSNPASWSTTGDQSESTVRVADPPAKNSSSSPCALPPLHVNIFKTLNQTAGDPSLRNPVSRTNSADPSSAWKPALLIWGGPILTLACLYILVAHFGWL